MLNEHEEGACLSKDGCYGRYAVRFVERGIRFTVDRCHREWLLQSSIHSLKGTTETNLQTNAASECAMYLLIDVNGFFTAASMALMDHE